MRTGRIGSEGAASGRPSLVPALGGEAPDHVDQASQAPARTSKLHPNHSRRTRLIDGEFGAIDHEGPASEAPAPRWGKPNPLSGGITIDSIIARAHNSDGLVDTHRSKDNPGVCCRTTTTTLMSAHAPPLKAGSVRI